MRGQTAKRLARAAAPREDARGGPGAGVLHKCLLVKRSEQQAALAFRALGEPRRVEIMRLLRSGPRAVGEIAAEVEVTQQAASQHLAVLKQAGVIADDKRGKQVFYRLVCPCILGMLDCLKKRN